MPIVLRNAMSRIKLTNTAVPGRAWGGYVFSRDEISSVNQFICNFMFYLTQMHLVFPL